MTTKLPQHQNNVSHPTTPATPNHADVPSRDHLPTRAENEASGAGGPFRRSNDDVRERHGPAECRLATLKAPRETTELDTPVKNLINFAA